MKLECLVLNKAVCKGVHVASAIVKSEKNNISVKLLNANEN